jgi:hypothetical protein
MKMDSKALNLTVEHLEKMLGDLKKAGPYLQAIVILDCPETEAQAFKIPWGTNLQELCSTFSEGPLRKLAKLLYRSRFTQGRMFFELGIINSLGFALILSRRAFEEAFAPTLRKTEDGEMSIHPLGPRIYDLNEGVF